MKKSYLLSLFAAALLVTGCSKENPFDNGEETAYGRLLTAALDVSLEKEFGPMSLKSRVRTKSPSAEEFTVSFYRDNSETPEAEYNYSEMPEIITLPVGGYVARATFGTNPDADWESPYYKGEVEFEIRKDEITDDVEPIECRIANIRVSVRFHDNLKPLMHPDCKVTVKVGDKGHLEFTQNDTVRSGYFAHVDNSQTLTATFEGTVDGYMTTESKVFKDVEPGKHYAITFRMHDAGEEEDGSIGAGDLIIVDANVSIDNIESDVATGEQPIEDTMRPQENFGDENPGDKTPETPDQPGDDDKKGDKPSVAVNAPLNIDIVNDLKEDSKVEFVVKSFADAGISAFTVVIDSNVLGPDDLEPMGIPEVIDLINCDASLAETLTGLGFPVKEKVKGQKLVEFNINDFVSTLYLLASMNDAPVKYFNFKLTVTDANGVTEKTLQLQIK